MGTLGLYRRSSQKRSMHRMGGGSITVQTAVRNLWIFTETSGGFGSVSSATRCVPTNISILIMLEPLGYGSRRPSPLPSSTSNAVASHPLVVFGMDHGSLSGSLPTDSLLGLLRRGGLEEKNLRYVVHPTISSVAR